MRNTFSCRFEITNKKVGLQVLEAVKVDFSLVTTFSCYCTRTPANQVGYVVRLPWKL